MNWTVLITVWLILGFVYTLIDVLQHHGRIPSVKECIDYWFDDTDALGILAGGFMLMASLLGGGFIILYELFMFLLEVVVNLTFLAILAIIAVIHLVNCRQRRNSQPA